MRCFVKAILLAATLFVWAIATPANAQINGACTSFEFGYLMNAEGELQEGIGFHARVVEDSAPVYDTSNSQGTSKTSLPFGGVVYIKKKVGEFFEVWEDARFSQTTLGWIHGDDLLCNREPVQSEKTDLPTKFFIKTEAQLVADEGTDGKQRSISVAASKNIDRGCESEEADCLRLTRFSLYYVHARDKTRGRLLLSDNFKVDVGTNVIGWVDEENGYLWETRIALRPKIDLVLTSEDVALLGRGEIGEERTICVYKDIETAREQMKRPSVLRECDQPIFGGERWFLDPTRIPVLDYIDGANGGPGMFRVAVPFAGVDGQADLDVFEKSRDLEASLKKLRKFKNVDVFFLIDGTGSMGPHIDAVVGRNGAGRGIIGAVQDAFTTNEQFSGAQVRFGFRVYRDIYADENGVGEGLPLGQECELSAEDLLEEHAKFEKEVRKIDTKKRIAGKKDPDEEESLFSGIVAAQDDMAVCDDYLKLLIIIGDTGNDVESQIKQGGEDLNEEDIIQFLTYGFSTTDKPIIPFFIQVPRGKYKGNARPGTIKKYNAAYDKFLPQAKSISEAISSHIQETIDQIRDGEGEDVSIEGARNLVLTMDGVDLSNSIAMRKAQQNIIDDVLGVVDRFANTSAINNLATELRSGTSLIAAIDQIRAAEKERNPDRVFGNVPGLRLALIEQSLCETLGSACREGVYEAIIEGYIPDEADIRTDLWVTFDEFNIWDKLLSAFRFVASERIKEKSELIVKQMVQTVGANIGEMDPVDFEMSMAEFLELRADLPVNEQSPLLQYSLGDIFEIGKSDGTGGGYKDVISLCELGLVSSWLERHAEVFNYLKSDELPTVERDTISNCGELKRDIPTISSIDGRLFEDREATFKHPIGEQTIFWIPREFLP